MVGIVDYGMGNLLSVSSAVEMCGHEPAIVSKPSNIQNYDKIILPGVGAFGDCIKNLKSHGFIDALNTHALVRQKPILGICLGMQVMATRGLEKGEFKGKKIAYHDSCYLGRVNGIYEAPRELLSGLDANIKEVKRNRKNGFCCGAGGAQVFKEEEDGSKKMNVERVDELLQSDPDIIAANCPYCIMMLNDGIKNKGKEDDVMIYDISELIIQANDW